MFKKLVIVLAIILAHEALHSLVDIVVEAKVAQGMHYVKIATN